MEFLANPVVAVVLLIGILVFVHEAGHFLVGKACGIPVEIFSIGFGPVIFGFQRGETHYRLSAIPLGGFVKFYGSLPSEDVPDFIKGREFFRSSILARLLTISAGPFFNMLLAILVFAAMVMHGIKQPPAMIGELVPNSPALLAGLEFEDKVLEINGRKVFSWKDLQRMISESPGKELVLKIERKGQVQDIRISPDSVKDDDLPFKRGRIGISPYLVPTVFTPLESVPADPNASAKAEGFLLQAGVKLGDRALKAKWQGQDIEVVYWQQWVRFLKELAASPDAKTFELVVQAYDPGKDDGKAADSAERVLTVTLPQDWRFDPSTLASSMGVASSQLTLFDVKEPANQLLQKGDLIESWNGKALRNLFELGEIAGDNRLASVELGILRAGQRLTLSVPLKPVEVQKLEGKATVYILPAEYWGAFVQPELVEEKISNPLAAIAWGFAESMEMTRNIGGALIGLFTGEMPLTTLGGPISIAKAASDSVRIGWQAFLNALALISINLALINLVPIPILDGGQLVLVSVEAILRRPVRERAIENYQKVGFVMVLALIVVATYNDVGRFWASMMRGMGSMF